MTNNRIIGRTVNRVLATAACMTAAAALAGEPVSNELHSWNIPAEDAQAAVRDFGIQSGVAISAEQKDIEGKRLNAVTGSLTVESALRQLVAGTGLNYGYDASGRAVSLRRATPASVQTPPQATTRRDPPTATEPPVDVPTLLEEIVVTARKRAENLQDVGLSVEVIGGQTITDYNIRSLTELSQSVPSIQLNPTGASGQFFIRGIGSGTGFVFDQSVGVFIDDIYHGRARVADEAFLDVDRVEVLKGPQSTFFGNNAVAGALNIVSAKPTDFFEGSVRALYGQYGQYAGEGVINIPINSELSVRIAAIGDGLSGWAKDPYARHDQPDQNNKAARITFLYRPSDDFDATLKVEGGIDHESDGSVVGGCPPPAPFASPPGASNFCAAALKAGYSLRVNNLYDTTNAGQGIDLSTFEDELTLHYRLGEHTLTSVTGFYNYHYTNDVDSDGTPLQSLNLQTAEAYHQFSQELRIASPQGQTFEYLGGVYFQEDRVAGHGGDITYYYLTPTVQKSYPALVPYLPLSTLNPSVQDEHSYSAFASADWNVTDKLKVGAGLRGSWVYKNASGAQVYGTAGTATYGGFVPLPASLQAVEANLFGTPKPAYSVGNSYNSAMPSAEIDYKIIPSIMLYATYARGFLAGVPTDVGYVVPNTSIVTPAIRPEHVNAYEAGFKSNLFANHLRLNFDVFRSNYTDLQVSSNTFITTATTSQLVALTTNAGSSRTQGAELSAEWVVSGFRFQTAVNYLNARYLSYPGVTLTATQSYCRTNPKIAGCVLEFPNGVGPTQDLSGKPTNFAPTWSGSLSASYTAALPRGYHFITQADVHASTTYYFGTSGTDDPELMQPGYARLDGRFTLEGPSGNWGLDLILKNLTDKVIFAGGAGANNLPASQGSTLLQIDQPRNVAVQGRYRW